MLNAIGKQYEEGNIDEEEHDLLLESIEDVDPEQRTFQKLGDDSDAFYDEGEMPDSPELKLGKRKNLDELMKSTKVMSSLALSEGMNSMNSRNPWQRISMLTLMKPLQLEIINMKSELKIEYSPTLKKGLTN